MNILVPLHGFVRWNGGLDLVRLMLSGIDTAPPCSGLQLTVAIPRVVLAHRLIGALGATAAPMVGTRRLARARARVRLSAIAYEIAGQRHTVACGRTAEAVTRAAKRAGAQVVFPSMLVLDRCPVPWIAYIPDFQHVHLPDFFSAGERAQRDRNFAALAAHSNGVVVNSRSAAQDVHEILGTPTSRILALPFAPHAQPQASPGETTAVRHKHGIAERYFIICNHFWAHKDHLTAFEAFARLRRRTADSTFQLVLTGETSDYRDPGYFPRLMDQARSLGIAPALRCLGLVPKAEQLALLQGSIALIQPTRYEGGPGGGSVYDAIGLGVRALVSDIPVNREIDTGEVSFFEVGNADDLAAKLEATLSSPHTPPDPHTLVAEGNRRLVALGSSIHALLRSTALAT